MTSTTYITTQMREAVGSQLIRRVSFPITDSDIRRWALAVYYPEMPPAWFLEARDGEPLRAPEEFNPFAWLVRTQHPEVSAQRLDPDYIEKVAGIEPSGLRNQINGGVESEYTLPMRSGDVITAVSRLTGYSEREGRLGRMLFTISEDEWRNQRDDLVKRQRFTLIRYA